MNRRGFLSGILAAVSAAFAPKAVWSPKPGDLVRLVSYPDFDQPWSLSRAYPDGRVIGPIKDPEVKNHHYRDGEQLYAVDFGIWHGECYADELRQRSVNGRTHVTLEEWRAA